jgi:DNA-binding NarL/FixJ family response regulator
MIMLDLNRVRVMVLDEQESVRNSLADFLENNDSLELVGTAANGMEAFSLFNVVNPDMVLMNLPMPDTYEATMMQQIGETHPTVQIVALSNIKDENLVRTALQVGVISCLLNDPASA